MVTKLSMGCLLTNPELNGILNAKRKCIGNKNYQVVEGNLELLPWKAWSKA